MFEELLHRHRPLCRVDLVEAMDPARAHGQARAVQHISEERDDGADYFIAFSLVGKTRLARLEEELLSPARGCVEIARVGLLDDEERAPRFGFLDCYPRRLSWRESDDAAQHGPSTRVLGDGPENGLAAQIRAVMRLSSERLVAQAEVVPLAERAATGHVDEEAFERVQDRVRAPGVFGRDARQRPLRGGFCHAGILALSAPRALRRVGRRAWHERSVRATAHHPSAIAEQARRAEAQLNN